MFHIMNQRWHEITFCHWPCRSSILQSRLPRGLSVDTMSETAWLSLTPFLLKGMRPPLFPKIISMEFPETNLRTYVLGPKGPGIWFFSLDAARAIAVAGARIAFGLPYYLAQMSVGISPTYVTYASKRDQASVAIRIAIGPAIEQP